MLLTRIHLIHYTLAHVANQLQVEPTYVVIEKVWLYDLTERDPVEGKVLVFGSLASFLKIDIYRFDPKVGHRQKNGQVILGDHFHVHL